MHIPHSARFWSVSIGHFFTDVLMSCDSVLLAFLSSSIVPMSNTQIGFLISTKQLFGALSQPLFGIRADKTGGRGVGTGGLLWITLTFMLALGLALSTRNYYVMPVPFILQGLGSGAFHPVGALHASEAEHAHSAKNTSYFFSFGQMGLATGPWLMGLLLDSANHQAILTNTLATSPVNLAPVFLLGIVTLPSIWFMYRTLPKQPERKLSYEASTGATTTRSAWLVPLLLVALLILLRGIASPGAVNFVPALFKEKGWSPAEYGAITSLFSLSSALMGIFFGVLADRLDRRRIIFVSMVASAPVFFLLPSVDGAFAGVLAVLAGGLSGGVHILLVLIGQELVPHKKGFASGATLGFIFTAGALGSLAIGALSDAFGLTSTFQIVAGFAFASGLLALGLPAPKVKYLK